MPQVRPSRDRPLLTVGDCQTPMLWARGGGTVDSVNAVEHVSPNGKEFLFDFGTCG
jgi:hypothetical protein